MKFYALDDHKMQEIQMDIAKIKTEHKNDNDPTDQTEVITEPAIRGVTTT